jgi:catechol 2,3-dioxygenase-like lactoylglutathione lyase family enzyme
VGTLSLASLVVGDAPGVWSSLGFVVDDDDGAVVVSGVRFVLDVGAPAGISGWSLADGVDGGAGDVVTPPDRHPNGVVALDHLVLSTPDVGRTIDELEGMGMTLRRVRDAGAGPQQAFFKLGGGVVLEVVGPAVPAGGGPFRFYGLAWTVRDLDATASFLGPRLRPAKAAVQEGRRIATLDKALGGSSVPMALMST